MKNKLIRSIVSLLLVVIVMFGSAIPAMAATNTATTIDSNYLFKESTLDDLKLNLKSLPTITVSGLSSSQYKITDEDTILFFGNNVKNRRIEFNQSAIGFNKQVKNLKLTVTYSNAGTLNGKAVDLILTYSDFWSAPQTNTARFDTKTLWWTAFGTLEQQTPQNEFFTVGFSKYNLDIQVKYRGSSQPVHLENAYFTLYSMDGSDIHSEAASAYGRATAVYWYKGTTVKYNSKFNNGLYTVNDLYYGAGNGDPFKQKSICFQYTNTDSINLDMVVTTGQWSEGYHINPIPLTATRPSAPVKTISTDKLTANDTVNYKITQKMPKAYDASFKLDTMAITDTLNKNLEYVSAKLLDDTGKDITASAGEANYIAYSNTVSYVFDTDYLKSAKKYDGQNVVFSVTAKAKNDVSAASIPNTAYSVINGQILKSNTVDVSVYYPVTVNYVDESGSRLALSEITDYLVGDTYTTTPKDIQYYELIETPSNASGTISNEHITVNYIYRLKDTSVLVNYINEDGKPICDSETIDGKIFDKYSTQPKEIYGYELIKTPNNATGEMTEEQITVNYIYKLKDSSVVVNYLDEDGQPLADSININGKVFDEYATEAKDFYGYHLTAAPVNATGTMTEEQITVNYIYTKKSAMVTANYIDENNVTLAKSIVVTGNVGDNYNTNSEDIYGYELVSVPDNAAGTMTETPIIVNYVYKLKNASVVVNYTDENGKKLADRQTLNGKVFDNYNTQQEVIYGYELIAVPDNATGQMTEKQITVNYIYRLKDTSVVVNYIDKDGNELKNSQTINGKVFDKYTTAQINIPGYRLVATPANANGTMTEKQIAVDYIYEKIPATVTVNYIDENGISLTDSILIEGFVLDEYTTVAKTFTGYELVEAPSNANGKMTEAPIVVNYIYKLKDTSVLVKHTDENGKKLANDEIINGKVFDSYTTKAQSIYGYFLTATPDNAAGEMTEEQIVVTYVYKLKNASVVVNYTDESGNKLEDSETINGKVFDEYETQLKDIYGYELIAVPDNSTGTMTEEQITVNYIYKLKKSSVIVTFVDEDNNTISENEIIIGKVFEKYETAPKEIYGYKLIKTPSNSNGIFKEDTLLVTYVYKLKDTSILVNYIDKDGNALADSQTTAGKVFDKYSTQPKEIYGYELIENPDNATGIMTEKQIVIDYIYRLKDTSVLINYIDENGKTLANSEIINGKVFDKYTTEQKEIYGYALISTPDNAVGTMSENQITVNYIYKLKGSSVVVNYLDKNSKPISENITISGNVFDKYTTQPKEIYGYTLITVPDNATGEITEEQITVNYIYELKNTTVVVNYTDENGQPLTDSITINGKVFDEYATEAKDFYGYRLTATPVNANGTMTEESITVNYIYTKKPAAVTVNYIDESGTVLEESIAITGNVNDSYISHSKEIYGYELIEAPSNANGIMTEEEIIVNYVYKLKDASVIINYIDEDGNELTDSQTVNGKVFDKYNTQQEIIYGYELVAVPDNATGEMTEEPITVNYIYKLKDSSVIVNFIDTNGNTLADSIIINGNVFDEYLTHAADISDYTLTETPSNASGTMSEAQIVVNYIYSKIELPIAEETKSPQTGDTSAPLALAATALLSSLFLIFLNRRKENAKK